MNSTCTQLGVSGKARDAIIRVDDEGLAEDQDGYIRPVCDEYSRNIA